MYGELFLRLRTVKWEVICTGESVSISVRHTKMKIRMCIECIDLIGEVIQKSQVRSTRNVDETKGVCKWRWSMTVVAGGVL